MKTTSGMVLLLVLLLTAGCAQPPTFEQELAVATGRVAEVEMALAEAQAGHAEEVERLRSNARIERQEYVNTIQQLRTELKSKSNLVLALQQTLTKSRTELRKLQDELAGMKEAPAPAPPEEPATTRALPPPRPPVVTTAEGAPAPPSSFPLRVEDLKVNRVVEGVRVQTIPRTDVSSSGPADAGGLDVEQQTTTEYGYQVRFTLRNPSPERKTVSVSAGKSTALLTVPAFGARASVITAEKGHALKLIVDEQTAEFPVAY